MKIPAKVFRELVCRLRAVRRCAVYEVACYHEDFKNHIESLWNVGVLSSAQYGRLHEMSRQLSLKTHGRGVDDGDTLPDWDSSAAGEVIDDSEPVSAPSALPGLRLLCLLVPLPSGESRSLPVHAMHRLPPYKGLSGRYYDGARKGGVALFPFDVSGGTGFYLRETYARTPSPEVLAHYSSRRKARAIYSNGKASAAGA